MGMFHCTCRISEHTFHVQYRFFFKSYRLWDNVEKYCRAGQVTLQYGACALHAGFQSIQIRTQNSFIHLAVCLKTGPKPFPKWALHIVRSRELPLSNESALRICNTYCFSTATMLAQTRLSVNVIRTVFVLLQWRRSVYWALRIESLTVLQVDLSSLERPYHGVCS
jgi:hypothetical protein